MKINKEPKAPMLAAVVSVDTGASQGARRATKDAPVSTRPLPPSIDSEVVAVAKRRSFSNADKRRIVLTAAACTKPGEIGALLRREGVYSSGLTAWRRQFAACELTGTQSKKRGPSAAPGRKELTQLAAITRERDKLRVQLSNAQLVIEVQKSCCVVGATRTRRKVRQSLMAGTLELTPALVLGHAGPWACGVALLADTRHTRTALPLWGHHLCQVSVQSSHLESGNGA